MNIDIEVIQVKLINFIENLISLFILELKLKLFKKWSGLK